MEDDRGSTPRGASARGRAGEPAARPTRATGKPPAAIFMEPAIPAPREAEPDSAGQREPEAPAVPAAVQKSPPAPTPTAAAPAKTAPAKTAPAKTAPAKTAPVKTAPVTAAPVKAAPVRAAEPVTATIPAKVTPPAKVTAPAQVTGPAKARMARTTTAAKTATPAKATKAAAPAKAVPAKTTTGKATKATKATTKTAKTTTKATAAKAVAPPQDESPANAQPETPLPTTPVPEIPIPEPPTPDAATDPRPVPSLWERVRAEPRQAPELLARASVERYGPEADRYTRWIRATYPAASDDRIAQAAARRFTAQARRSALAAVVGHGAGEAAALGWVQARMVLHIAAAYRLDPAAPERAAELLALMRPARVSVGVGVRAAGRGLATRLVPGAGVLLGALLNDADTGSLARRAIRLYRPVPRLH